MPEPASNWIDAFPDALEPKTRALPPARPRTRTNPASPEVATPPTDRPASDIANPASSGGSDISPSSDGPGPEPRPVGYKSPPVHSRFKPGQSGNPKGRPKGAKGLNTLVRETMGAKVVVRTANGTKKISKIEAVLQKTAEKAMKGDTRALMELMKLWRSAVPESSKSNEPEEPIESLTDTDLATLEAYRETFEPRLGDQT